MTGKVGTLVTITGSGSQYPARASLVWYLGLVVLGTMALKLPGMQPSGVSPIAVVDAVFTATSAACVTGLSVRSTGSDFTWAGQLAILVLIQVGGIGIMTVTTFVTSQLGRRGGLRERAVMAETLGARGELHLRGVLWQILRFTFGFELAGALALLPRFLFDYSWSKALWHAVFHSVSAFCNAGFGLHDDSLMQYRDDLWVNLTIMVLIVAGGLGFPVVLDLVHCWRGGLRWDWRRLHLHSKLMLLGTTTLLVVGTISFLTLEWGGVLAELPLGNKVLAAAFHSTTCRTAGFNTVDLPSLSNASIFVTILLMAIGAGPCSTAGGFKVSTLAAVLLRSLGSFRGRRTISLFGRTIPSAVFERANATLLLFMVLSVVALLALLVAEPERPTSQVSRQFAGQMFEVVSALGTVGLSLGTTAQLSLAAKWVVIVLMLLGRLGPISMIAALAIRKDEHELQYPHEEPLIG